MRLLFKLLQMKIKFTWGTGIFITIIMFVTFFVSFIIFSLTQDINLVSKDYFPEEIAYGSKLEKIRNADALKNKITIEQKDNLLIIHYPKKNKNLSGIIKLYFVKNSNFDIDINIKIADNKQIINIEKYKKGRYYIKIDWKFNEIEYFQKFNITF